MFAKLSTVASLALAALGSLTFAAAQDPKETGGKTGGLPKELTVDLGKGVKLKMVLIPAGEFKMGSPASEKDALDLERPQHQVRITRPFYLGRYLVTQEQWEAVMGREPQLFQGSAEPGGTGQLGRLPAVSRQTAGTAGQSAGKVSVAQRGPMGICLPRGKHNPLLLWGRGDGAGRVWVV